MSRLIYPGSRKIEGPWLLDKDSLQKFETMINELVSEFCHDSGEEYKPEYTITFSDGKRIIEQSLLNFDINNDIETHYTITRFYVRLTAVISMVLRTVKGG